MPAIGSVNVKISASTMGLNKGLSSAASSISSFGSSMLSMASGVGLATAGMFGLTSAASLVSSAVESASNMEQAEIAFGVLFKSVSTAKTVLSGLSDFAAETPFELPELTSAAKSLAAFGIAANDVVPELRMLGDISAGIGAPITEIATLYGKAKVQGRLFAKDINELTGRGIPVIGELAKQFGVAENKVQDLVTEGKIGFPEVQKAFQAMTGSGGQFEKLMEKQSKSLGGIWSTLKDNIGLTLSGIATDLIAAFDVKSLLTKFIGFTGMIKDGMKSITPVIISIAGVFSAWWGAAFAGINALFGGLLANSGLTFAGIIKGVTSAGETMKGFYEAITPIAAAAGATLAAYWTLIANGAMVAFNYVTTTLSSLFTNISTIFGEITGIAGMTFSDVGMFILDALILGEFLFNNFSEVALFAFENVKLGAVTLFNDIGHFFTGVIPAWFTWFGKNWSDVFFSAFDLASTIFINLGLNIRKMFSSLWDFITSGFRSSLKIDWTPLKEGAVNTVKSLPDIPARAVTELEQSLKNNVGKMGDSLGSKFGDHMVKRRDELLGKPPELPKRVNVTGALATAGAAVMPGMTPVNIAAKKPLEAVAGLNRNSSDATSAIFKAMRNDTSNETKKIAQDSLKAQTKMATALDKMTKADGITWAAGEVIV